MSKAKRIELVDEDTGEILATAAPFFKTPYNHDCHAEALATGTINNEKSMTQQNAAEEADINTIVKRFGITGQLPNVVMPPTVQDFTEVFDFQSAMNVLAAAKESFAKMPAEVRAQFGNNPAGFVSYVDAAVEAGDLEQLRKWGLAVPAAPAPQTPPGEPGTPLTGSEEPKT